MARRKTRQQKIIADLRRQLSTTKTEPIRTKEVSENKVTIKSVPQVPQHLTYTNPYLAKDLKKTAILTAGIILGQLFLFFLFRQHILILPGISY